MHMHGEWVATGPSAPPPHTTHHPPHIHTCTHTALCVKQSHRTTANSTLSQTITSEVCDITQYLSIAQAVVCYTSNVFDVHIQIASLAMATGPLPPHLRVWAVQIRDTIPGRSLEMLSFILSMYWINQLCKETFNVYTISQSFYTHETESGHFPLWRYHSQSLLLVVTLSWIISHVYITSIWSWTNTLMKLAFLPVLTAMARYST